MNKIKLTYDKFGDAMYGVLYVSKVENYDKVEILCFRLLNVKRTDYISEL